MCSSFSSPPSGSRISSAAGSPLCGRVRQREERLDRGRHITERRHQIPLGVLDPLADGALLGGLEQLSLADVLQVDADEIDFLAPGRYAGFDLFFFLDLGPDDLVLEGLGLLVVKDLLRAWRKWLTGVFDILVRIDRETELLRPMAPVEDMCLLGRIIQSMRAFRRFVGVNSSVFLDVPAWA